MYYCADTLLLRIIKLENKTLRLLILNVLPGEKPEFIVFGKNIVSYLLNETTHCGLNDTSFKDVAIDDYFMHDSDGVFLAL